MPPGPKSARNKKKNGKTKRNFGGAGRGGGGGGRGQRPTGNSGPHQQQQQQQQQQPASLSSSSTSSRLPTDGFPNFSGFLEAVEGATDRKQNPNSNSKLERENQRQEKNAGMSLYSRYKRATSRFIERLRGKVPREFFETDRVNSLMDAADYISDHNSDAGTDESTDHDKAQKIEVDDQLMDDLATAIRIRKRVAKALPGGGDRGHAHFVTVLSYCWTTLRPLQKKEQEKKKTSSARGTRKTASDKPAQNRFAFLAVDDDNDEDLPTEPVQRPSKHDESADPLLQSLTLEELIKGEDRFAATLFLMALDELMGHTSDQYVALKGAWQDDKANGYPPQTIIEHLMETAVAVNFNIQEVASLELQLATDHPHLDTYYRVMAVMVMSEFTENVSKLVRANSPIANQFKEADAIKFLGSCLENGFRAPSDPRNTSSTIGKEFASIWKVPAIEMQRFAEEAAFVARLEAPISEEKASVERLMSKAGNLGLKSHNWLPKSKFIGCNRSISNTVRLLQGLSTVVHRGSGPMTLRRGFFGRQWNEFSNRATRIQGDLDELLMGDLLPVIIHLCKEGMLAATLPFERELLTFFTEIKNFVKNPEKPISWTLAFSVHSLLTSILEVQGNNNVRELGEQAKDCFDLFKEHLEWAKEVSHTLGRSKYWMKNLDSLLNLQYLVVPRFRFGQQDMNIALWNPLCAGLFVSYVVYFGNLEGGLTMVDSFGQLRLVLHLFNALKNVGILSSGQLEVLDWLYEQFASSKAIWEGPPPTKGQFVTRWWIAWGSSVRSSQKASKSTKDRYTKGSFGAASVEPMEAREMTALEPQDLAVSFRRICLRDFSEVEDNYHSGEQYSSTGKLSVLYDHAVRLNDTLDSMENDQRLLATHLVALSEVLGQFLGALFRLLELAPIVDKIVREMPDSIRQSRRVDFRRVGANSWEAGDDNLRRQTEAYLFAERILGAADFDPNPSNCEILQKAGSWMYEFFSRVHPSRILIFTPTRFVTDDDESGD